MSQRPRKVALVCGHPIIIGQIEFALAELFVVDVFKTGFELNAAMEKGNHYKAIISDDELSGINGIRLHRTLCGLGHTKIPFMLLLSHLDSEQRKLAIDENIAEIFSKPLHIEAINLRVKYLSENFAASASGYAEGRGYKLPLIKRIFDVTLSGLALVILSPLFLIIAMLIRAESRGPIFHHSFRVGSAYRIFKFYKFRCLITGAEASANDLSHAKPYHAKKEVPTPANDAVKEIGELCEQCAGACTNRLNADKNVVCEKVHKLRRGKNNDLAFIKIKSRPRITKFGSFIRDLNIDELPQLWNVFIGDMSIIGNKPLPLYEAEKITSDKYSLRFMAPPGITGWQLGRRGRGERSASKRLLPANSYAEAHSLRDHIKLMVRTIPALFQSQNV